MTLTFGMKKDEPHFFETPLIEYQTGGALSWD
jgi:hypothetical protein